VDVATLMASETPPPKGFIMNAAIQLDQRPNRSATQAALRVARLLVGTYLALSVATLAAIILLRNDASIVNQAVWIRGTIVAATSVLMFGFATAAARGSVGAYRRLRLTSTVVVVAIIVIIALPGTFPTWLKVEQAVCGLVLIGVVGIANGTKVRSLFAAN
jgi:hypothetical protein